jgi:hypothetical protein
MERDPGKPQKRKTMKCSPIICLIWLTGIVTSVQAGRMVNLIEGNTLNGWTIVGAPNGGWYAKDGVLTCNGVGRPRHYLRTDEMYENFVLELEWKLNSPKGNSGVFLFADALPQVGAPYPESVETQIYALDHGSIFGIRGAVVEPLGISGNKGKTIVAHPTEERCRPVGQWNRYQITANHGVIELRVNGEAVTLAFSPGRRKGYIALQAEHHLVEFRKLRIYKLPSTDPPTDQVAKPDAGHFQLFDGMSFAGWKHLRGHDGHWTLNDGEIHYDGKATGKQRSDKDLWTWRSFGGFHLIADWRLPAKPTMKEHPVVLPNGDFVYLEGRKRKTFPHLDAGDSGMYLRGSSKAQLNIWSQKMGSGEINGYRTDTKQPPDIRRACIPSHNADNPLGKWNRFEITMKGDRVTVILNDQRVINRARLQGIPTIGPIALQHHNDPVEFRNIFIRPLN